MKGYMVDTKQNVSISSIYRFLAQGMHYPDHQWMTTDFFKLLLTILEDLGGVEEKHDIEQLIVSRTAEHLLEELQIEYTRLFVTHHPHTIAPPYGSVYMDQALQSVFTEHTTDYYRQKNFVVTNHSTPPDHLVTELEFLSLLTEQKDSQGEKEFLQSLFRPWFEQFHQKIITASCNPYYRIMMQLIDFFTKEDEDNGI